MLLMAHCIREGSEDGCQEISESETGPACFNLLANTLRRAWVSPSRRELWVKKPPRLDFKTGLLIQQH